MWWMCWWRWFVIEMVIVRMNVVTGLADLDVRNDGGDDGDDGDDDNDDEDYDNDDEGNAEAWFCISPPGTTTWGVSQTSFK